MTETDDLPLARFTVIEVNDANAPLCLRLANSLAAKIAADTGMIGPAGHPTDGGWNGFNVLHTAASRVAALDLGFVPGQNSDGIGGRDVAAIVDGAQKGEIDFIYLLGADECDVAHLGRAFVVYQGSHGDAGAHNADVVLPGAAYTEKEVLYLNFEGRVQPGHRAVFPPGEAKEDWTILRALSDVLGKRLAYDTLDALRAAMVADAPHFADHHELVPHGGATATDWTAVGGGVPLDTAHPLGSTMTDYYLTNPIARASATMAECSREFVTGASQMAAE